jgi:hypothetical protein
MSAVERFRRRWWLLAAALVVVAAVAAVVLVRARDNSKRAAPVPVPATTTVPARTGGTPAWFDPALAPPVYESKSYDVDQAATRYLESRSKGLSTSLLKLAPAEVKHNPGAFDTATALLSTAGGDGALVATGVVHLRVDGGDREWEVVGAFANDVDVQGATFADGQARVYGVNHSGATARFVRRRLDGTVIDERTLESHAMISR